ncbi:hypothetical protein M0Q97_08490 [Candidatus Dojkabacteria bacterium]|nr:hypothetical protein [Candidatus Dojkabacteria bacterium]
MSYMYVIAAHEKNGELVEFKQVYDLNHPEIEFQFSKDVIIYSIQNGNKLKTAYWKYDDGKPCLVEGSEIVVTKDNNLRTLSNGVISDNLSSLSRY